MWKSLFFLGIPGRKWEKPLWNGCDGRVERKAAPCSFTHPRGNPAVECGKKVENKRKGSVRFSTGFVECGKLIHRDVKNYRSRIFLMISSTMALVLEFFFMFFSTCCTAYTTVE